MENGTLVVTDKKESVNEDPQYNILKKSQDRL